jgi:hypothetical protein
MRSPVSNPFARFQNAEALKRDAMMKNHVTFFKPWETIHESNPQEILERHEAITTVPLLIMQGGLDDNVLPAVQEKFAATYRAAGGVMARTSTSASSTSGSQRPVRKRIEPARWSRRSSPATCASHRRGPPASLFARFQNGYQR